MSITRLFSGRRSAAMLGVVALAVGASIASLALTGPATAGDSDDYNAGWPTELFEEGNAATDRFNRASDRVISYRTREVRGTGVDADGDGDFSPGDYFVFEERLFRGGEQVGRDSVRCMVNHRSIMCDGTLFTGAGNIEVAGSQFFEGRGFQLAVTGGTGRYRDAAGTLAAKSGGPGPSDRLIVRLVD